MNKIDELNQILNSKNKDVLIKFIEENIFIEIDLIKMKLDRIDKYIKIENIQKDNKKLNIESDNLNYQIPDDLMKWLKINERIKKNNDLLSKILNEV